MFKDLKEYQEITRIYHESVNISEEQRAINKAFYLSLEIPGEKQRFYNNMVDFLEQKD